MIKDNIKNAQNYYNLSEHVKLGLEYLKNTDFSKVENGKYILWGKEVFAIIQDYTSKPQSEGDFEAHKKYTDIQYIIEGDELIGVSDIENFSQITDYDEGKDIVFLAPKNDVKLDFIHLKEKDFAIFTPKDAHKPSLAVESPSRVKKVVVKVQV